jgi:hypothetical protein
MIENVDYKASEDSVVMVLNVDSNTLSTIHHSARPAVDSKERGTSVNVAISPNMAMSNFSAAGLSTASIVVPLYQYPLRETTWAPLYNA